MVGLVGCTPAGGAGSGVPSLTPPPAIEPGIYTGSVSSVIDATIFDTLGELSPISQSDFQTSTETVTIGPNGRPINDAGDEVGRGDRITSRLGDVAIFEQVVRTVVISDNGVVVLADAILALDLVELLGVVELDGTTRTTYTVDRLGNLDVVSQWDGVGRIDELSLTIRLSIESTGTLRK
jgi:hypothetical protein